MEKEQEINKIREFNRFYTTILGLLDQYLLDSAYTLTEVRILYEIGKNHSLTAKQITDSLHIDKGYLSRIIKRFEKKGMITRSQSAQDAREVELHLTPLGKKELLVLNQSSSNQIHGLLEKLNPKEKKALIESMQQIQIILTKTIIP